MSEDTEKAVETLMETNDQIELEMDRDKSENKENTEDIENSDFNINANGSEINSEIEDFLKEGTLFDSYEAFQTVLNQYSDLAFAQFSHQDSSTIEKLSNADDYNKKLVYTHINFACIYGGKKLPSKSSGIRNSSSRKIGCPVKIRLSATSDRQQLVIKESQLNCHNHVLSEENYRLRCLDDETELEIYNLISIHENKRVARQLVRDKLEKETGKIITTKDINNIEKRVSKKLEKTVTSSIEISSHMRRREPDGRILQSEEDDSIEKDSTEKDSTEKDDQDLPESKSPVRPKRQIREPERFRGKNAFKERKGKEDVTKEDDKISKNRISKGCDIPESSPAKVERRGRKRKTEVEPILNKEPVIDTEQKNWDGKTDRNAERNNEIQERQLEIQEQLLQITKEKVELLKEISLKLDKVLENQAKG